jgi:hypothetical protein
MKGVVIARKVGVTSLARDRFTPHAAAYKMGKSCWGRK